jgi:hypothetical protein
VQTAFIFRVEEEAQTKRREGAKFCYYRVFTTGCLQSIYQIQQTDSVTSADVSMAVDINIMGVIACKTCSSVHIASFCTISLSLFFDPEDGLSIVFRKVELSTNYTASQPENRTHYLA